MLHPQGAPPCAQAKSATKARPHGHGLYRSELKAASAQRLTSEGVVVFCDFVRCFVMLHFIGKLLQHSKDLPLRCSGNFTTSKLPDGQAMMEGTMSMLAAVQCWANFILHAAGFLDVLLSMS